MATTQYSDYYYNNSSYGYYAQQQQNQHQYQQTAAVYGDALNYNYPSSNNYSDQWNSYYQQQPQYTDNYTHYQSNLNHGNQEIFYGQQQQQEENFLQPTSQQLKRKIDDDSPALRALLLKPSKRRKFEKSPYFSYHQQQAGNVSPASSSTSENYQIGEQSINLSLTTIAEERVAVSPISSNYATPPSSPKDKSHDDSAQSGSVGIWSAEQNEELHVKGSKRTRQTYTRYQTQELMKEFSMNKYLTRRKRIEIAHRLQLSERQIKIWFQNKRMAHKKNDPLIATSTTSEILYTDEQQITQNYPATYQQSSMPPHPHHHHHHHQTDYNHAMMVANGNNSLNGLMNINHEQQQTHFELFV